MFLLASFVLLCLAEPKLEYDSKHVVVAGLDTAALKKLASIKEEDLHAHGSVSVAKSKPEDERPILGEWSAGGKLAFHPRIPFERGVKYHVRFKDIVDATFEIPEGVREPGVITDIFPKAERLPANVLRFYVHFDRPMKEGQGYGQFKLLDGDGKEVKHAFLELDEELWDPEARRLTLLFDPGRVKNELVPREELGPVLQPNRKYTLVVGKDFRTAEGVPLKQEYRKAFRTMAEDMKGLDPKDWKIAAPTAGETGKLSLAFGKPLDSGLLERVISVEDAAGKSVAGRHIPPTDETTWNWRPDAAWKPGNYFIVVGDVLEDVCGNRIGAAFDEAIGVVGARKEKAATKLPFTVK